MKTPLSPVSPKILAGANAGIILGLVVTLIGAMTPDSLSFLGKWAPLVYSLLAILAFAITAYQKTDSIREAGVAALQKAAEEAAAAAEASKQTSLAATAVDVPTTPAPAVSFAPTQAKIDALPVVPDPIVTPVSVPASVPAPTPAPAVAASPTQAEIDAIALAAVPAAAPPVTPAQ